MTKKVDPYGIKNVNFSLIKKDDDSNNNNNSGPSFIFYLVIINKYNKHYYI
mgnify:CR=1 FL=1